MTPNQYLACFSFRTTSSSEYWLPLFLVGENTDRIIKIMDAVSAAIREQGYELLHREGPKLLKTATWNNEILQAAVKAHMIGERAPVVLNIWDRKVSVPGNPNSFSEYCDRLFDNPDMYAGTTVASTKLRLPVKARVLKRDNAHHDEYLVLDVLDPQ